MQFFLNLENNNIKCSDFLTCFQHNIIFAISQQ